MADFIHVNLLPIEYRIVRRDFSWIIDLRLLIPITALVAAGMAWVMVSSYFESNLQTQHRMLDAVNKEISDNAYVAQKIGELEKLRDERTAKNNSLKSISVSKRRWVRILEGVNKSLPLNMWIESITQADANENELEIKGRTYVFPEVAEYLLQLGKDEYFQATTLGSVEFTREAERASFQFIIRVSINPNAGIDVLVKDDKHQEKVL